MNRTYSQGWADIFGKDLPKKPPLEPTFKPAKKPKASEPRSVVDASTVSSADIDWMKTRALSIRQPWAELIMRGDKEIENRSGPARIRGRIAIDPPLSKEDLPEAEHWGLDPKQLPHGVIIGTVELYDCDGSECHLRDPKRLGKPIKPTKHPQPVWSYPIGCD